jgi:hypothetical protein
MDDNFETLDVVPLGMSPVESLVVRPHVLQLEIESRNQNECPVQYTDKNGVSLFVSSYLGRKASLVGKHFSEFSYHSFV